MWKRFRACFSSPASRQHSKVPREADNSQSSFSVNFNLGAAETIRLKKLLQSEDEEKSHSKCYKCPNKWVIVGILEEEQPPCLTKNMQEMNERQWESCQLCWSPVLPCQRRGWAGPTLTCNWCVNVPQSQLHQVTQGEVKKHAAQCMQYYIYRDFFCLGEAQGQEHHHTFLEAAWP